MKFRSVLSFLFCLCLMGTSALQAGEAGKLVYGPARFDVKERYGAENVYKVRFEAADTLFAVQLQNGDLPAQRSEFIQLSLNGETVLRDDWYPYTVIVCVIPLRKENDLRLVLKDVKPSGFRRPPLPARYVTVSVLPRTLDLPPGAYGAVSHDGLRVLEALVKKIRNRDSSRLAAEIVDLTREPSSRADAMQNLAKRRDKDAFAFIQAVFQDMNASPSVRGEAALGLGMLGRGESVPLLMKGILDTDEPVRLGAARALSLYPEEDTRGPFINLVERLDTFRREGLTRTMEQAVWKPVALFRDLIKSPDASVATTALELLIRSGVPDTFDLLLQLLHKPGAIDLRVIISKLGETGNSKAVGPLADMARDRATRAGKEAELAEALATLGDRSSETVIAELAGEAPVDDRARFRVRQAYKKLTGRDYTGDERR